MGQMSCKACDCNISDVKLDGEFKTDYYLSYQGFRDTMHSIFHSEYQEGDIVRYHIKSLIKTQSFIKSLVARKKYLKQIKDLRPVHKYFTKAELSSFITSNRFVNKKEVVKEKPYKKGGFYSGELLGGFRHGKGIMTWKDQSVYTGTWSFGVPAGQGKFVYPDGDEYSGHWGFFFDRATDQELNGFGLVLWKDKVVNGYKWLWCKSKISLNSPRSIGMTPRNEEKKLEIQSRFLELKHIFDIKSNSRKASLSKFPKDKGENFYYQGEKKNEKKHGFGQIVWQGGESYQGDWANDEQSGWGVHSWPDGSKYSGFFYDSLKEGIGCYEWPDGSSYLGQWMKNEMSGVGRYIFNTQKVFIGEFLSDQIEGFGSMFTDSSLQYEGFWHNGKKHGEGVTYYLSGKQSRDLWQNGKIIKPDI